MLNSISINLLSDRRSVKTAIAHAEALPPTNLGGFIDVTKNAHSRYISINFL
ncbi:hypothetical protein [Nostoc sp. CCY 9925]|uniref:hypothetical protein n=1 Tax=Nostoc sp. CCY 9925 TaxID=3103865 RepID=UPI0039C63F8A